MSIVTKGTLYVVTTRDDVNSIADLAGKTVVSTGQGSTPEYAIDYILSENGLSVGEDVTVEYVSETAELASRLAAGTADIAVMPEPFVTSVLMQNENAHVALDLTAEWDAVSPEGSGLVMSAVLVQQKLIDEHPEAIAAFLEEYEASIAFVNDSETLPQAAELVAEQGIIAKAEIAEKAIPGCNIVFLTGDEMVSACDGFLSVLYEANPQSVGGTLPDENLYYIAQ